MTAVRYFSEQNLNDERQQQQTTSCEERKRSTSHRRQKKQQRQQRPTDVGSGKTRRKVANNNIDDDNGVRRPRRQQKRKGSRAPGTEKKEFVSFFQEVDNLDSKASIASFFESLGKPPTQAKSTMPPQPRTTRRPTLASENAKTDNDSSGTFLLGEGKSIFDVFPVPDAPPPSDNPNAYDEEAYRQYRDVLDEVVNESRFRRLHTKKPYTEEFMTPILSWLQASERTVEYNLPLLLQQTTSIVENSNKEEEDLKHDNNSDGMRKDLAASFRNELTEQREAFLKHVPLTNEQYQRALVALRLLGNLCAKRARSLPLEVAWEKVKEAGMCLDRSDLNGYLYSCSMYVSRSKRGSVFFSSSTMVGDSILNGVLGSMPPSSNRSDDDDKTSPSSSDDDGNEEYVVDLPEEIATFHDLLYEPTEDSVTIRIKALVAKGNASGAEALLNKFPLKKEEARQRTYLPILRCYLEQGDISSGLRLFKQMRETPTCVLEAETYISLISAIAERGYFSNDSTLIKGAEELGYSSHGSKLFDQLARDMADDVLEITSASARRLFGAFESALKEQSSGREYVEMHPLAPLPIDNDPAADNQLIVSRTVVDEDTGICPRSGAKLRLLNLDDHQRQELRQSLLKLAETTFNGWVGNKRTNQSRALVALREFSNWLDTRKGEPFTAFIDGPNVAYYFQNFEGGKFNIFQLEFMLNALANIGENPLIIMPHKYCLRSFSTSGSRGAITQHQTDKEMAVLERLYKDGRLYRVPPGCLDDFYWMLASVSDQKVARGGRNMEVQPGDESGRWPGTRPMLVSNDQMRDHKLGLLEPRLFRRWYSCYIVNYNFTAFVDDECVDREISFSTADFFSREIQGNPTHNSDGTYSGMAWHFPVSDWETRERLCVRLPVKNV